MGTRRAAGTLLAGAVGGLLALTAFPAAAAVKPHGLFTDGAVLQRTKFLTVNKNHIDWIMPAEDSDAAARRHS